MTTKFLNLPKVGLITLLTTLLPLTCLSASENESISIRVEQTLKVAPRFSWQAAFDLVVEEKTITIVAAINLIPQNGINRIALKGRHLPWKGAIEKVWNKRYQAKTSDGRCYPINVEVSFIAQHFHHRVVVVPGNPGADAAKWGLESTDWTIAHEFGHMIGAYDEYEAGALDPAGPIIDPESIMTRRPSQGEAMARHFHLIRDRLSIKLFDLDLEIVPMTSKKCR